MAETKTAQKIPPVNALVKRVKRAGRVIWNGSKPAYRSEHVQTNFNEAGGSWLDRTIELVMPALLPGGEELGIYVPDPDDPDYDPTLDPDYEPPEPPPEIPPELTGGYALATLALEPDLYWRLGANGLQDISGNGRHGIIGVVDQPDREPWEPDLETPRINTKVGPVADGDGCATLGGHPDAVIATVEGHDLIPMNGFRGPYRGGGYYPLEAYRDFTCAGFIRWNETPPEVGEFSGGSEFLPPIGFGYSDDYRIDTDDPTGRTRINGMSLLDRIFFSKRIPKPGVWFHFACAIRFPGWQDPENDYEYDASSNPYGWRIGSIELYVNGKPIGESAANQEIVRRAGAIHGLVGEEKYRWEPVRGNDGAYWGAPLGHGWAPWRFLRYAAEPSGVAWYRPRSIEKFATPAQVRAWDDFDSEGFLLDQDGDRVFILDTNGNSSPLTNFGFFRVSGSIATVPINRSTEPPHLSPDYPNVKCAPYPVGGWSEAALPADGIDWVNPRRDQPENAGPAFDGDLRWVPRSWYHTAPGQGSVLQYDTWEGVTQYAWVNGAGPDFSPPGELSSFLTSYPNRCPLFWQWNRDPNPPGAEIHRPIVFPERRRYIPGDERKWPTGDFYGWPAARISGFKGDFDEFACWSRRLSPGEIAALYAEKDTPPEPPPP